MYRPPQRRFPAPDLAFNVLTTIACALLIIAQGSQGALALVA